MLTAIFIFEMQTGILMKHMPKRTFRRQGGTPLNELAKELNAKQHQADVLAQSQISRAASAEKRGEAVLAELGLESSSRLALGRLVLSVTPDIQSLLGLEEIPPFIHPNPHSRVSLIRARAKGTFVPVKFAQKGYAYMQRHDESREPLEGKGHLRLFSPASTPPFHTVQLIVDPNTPAGEDMIRESQKLSWEFSCQPKTLKPNAILYSLDIPECMEERVPSLMEKINYAPVTFALGAVTLGYNYVRPDVTP